MSTHTTFARTLWIAAALALTTACGEDAAETPAEPTEPPAVTETAEAPPAEPPAEPESAPLPAPSAELLADATALGTLAAEIDAEPTRAAAILTAHEVTIEDFEARLYATAAHPALTLAYTAARTPAAE